MRFIGNKEKIIFEIHTLLQKNKVIGTTFCDFFTGTTNVAKFYKHLGYQVYSSDLLYLSYCLQKAYIQNNTVPQFKAIMLPSQQNVLCSTPLSNVLEYLNSLPLIKGFIYHNYTDEGSKGLALPRKYFTSENGQKIDAIRQKIEEWKHILPENEYYILLCSLIESVPYYANISGVYAAFHKKWDPRALKPFLLRPVQLCFNNFDNYVNYGNSLNLCNSINVDILYIDPPYNQRQYAPNYHLLETIALYDNPIITGVSGMRNYSNQKSQFCNAKTALEGLDFIAKTVKYNFLVLSYNSEGIMKQEDIIRTLKQYGNVVLEEFPYTRYKSNSNSTCHTNRYVYEQLYILKKDE